MNEFICYITKKSFPEQEVEKGDSIRNEILQIIQKDFPDFNKDSYICLDELNKYRKIYVSRLINREVGDLDIFEKEAVEVFSKNQILVENIEKELHENLTFGQRMADKIAKFGGSWSFIITFFSFIMIWIGINIWVLLTKPFDPYPFILLNLILSCLAAIQAPIIMMSQNRQEEKDRKRSENDYKVNFKSELEIRLLHEKLDHLMTHQHERLLEIQELQTDYLEDILKLLKNHN